MGIPPIHRHTPYFARGYQRNVCRMYRTELDASRGLHLPVTRSGCGVWHRGAGKGATVTGGIIIPSVAARPGKYIHVFPSYVQGKGALWEEAWWRAMWPEEWEPEFIGTELTVRLKVAGEIALVKLIGADKREDVDKHRGSNPLGIVFDEASEMDENVRELSARLAVNGGWEILIGTPKGRNWFHKAYLASLERDDFYAELLTIDDTRRDAVDFEGRPLPGEDGSPVVGPAEIELERAKGKSEDWIQQEFYCAFNAAVEGAIYGDRLTIARASGRVTRVPYDSNKPVGVMTDLGIDDPTALLYYQVHGREIAFIDYDAMRGKEAGEVIAHLHSKPYVYGLVYLPHDAANRSVVTKQTVYDKFRERMRCLVKVVPKPASVEAGIDTVRAMFSRLVFDEVACSREPSPNLPSLLTSVAEYKRGWSPIRQDWSGDPVHDAASHAMDALRTGLVGFREGLNYTDEDQEPLRVHTDFQIFESSEEREDRRRSRIKVIRDFDAFGRAA